MEDRDEVLRRLKEKGAALADITSDTFFIRALAELVDWIERSEKPPSEAMAEFADALRHSSGDTRTLGVTTEEMIALLRREVGKRIDLGDGGQSGDRDPE